MSPKTRRRVFVTVLVVALSAPIEMLFLSSVLAANSEQWASSLAPASLNAAAAQIQSYPYAYRRAIMGALPPARRSQVWINHIDQYIRSHSTLDAATVTALQTTEGLLTPDFFADPSSAQRASLHAAADQIQTLIGKDDARYLMFLLGPADSAATQAAVPVSMRFREFMQNHITTLSADQAPCDCEMSFGCYDGATHCSSATQCKADGSWPACGWFWADTCDGACVPGPM